MRQKKTLLCICLTAGALFGYSQEKPVKLLKTFAIESAGGWDYLAVGPINDLLYVSHGTQVNILNKITGDSVAVIANTTGVHGIAFDPANNEGFTSNGRINTVTVFDLKTNKAITQIPTGANPDAIMYEPFSKKIITCNGRGKSLTIIEPKENKAVDSIDLGGKPETAVTDGRGKLFVNIEDKNEIVVVDMEQRKVVSRWSLAPGEGPSGLAIDKKTGRLFSACDKLVIVLDTESGRIVDKLPIGDGCDGVVFDDGSKNIYSSNGEGSITVIHEKNKNSFQVTGTVVTQKSARTIALDEKLHQLFLPAAEFEIPAPGQTGRPKMKPGSFHVLVFGQ